LFILIFAVGVVMFAVCVVTFAAGVVLCGANVDVVKMSVFRRKWEVPATTEAGQEGVVVVQMF